MSDQTLFPCGQISRRHIFKQSIGALLGGAVGALWAEDGKLDARLPGDKKADAVIFLFMCGGVSHIDTFDPKGNKYAGKLIDAIGFGDNVAEMKRPVIPCLRTFKNYGQSGIPVSDWFPNVGGVIDDIAVVRSMWCQEGNHFPAVIETQTGHRGRAFDNPSFGGWVSYALGSGNKNLPTYVNVGRASSPVQLTGGYLGASYSATPFQAGPVPIPNLKPPASSNAAERDRQMESLTRLNREFRERHELNTDIAARIESYELAGRMQLSAPGIVDLSKEPQHVLDLYGIGEKPTDDFGRQLLMARRLVENGVRFVQICHAGGGNGSWDAHGDMKTHEPLCRAVDKPIAGLIQDLKQRSMLQRTLVVFTSEFGRSPWSQNTTGRDHNPKGYSSWFAGGGIKGGTVHGATDDYGYKAVESPHYYSDLHATILKQLGLDHKKMQHRVFGRNFRLVEEGHGPIEQIIA
ncbi:MAG: hypothetical protein JWN34_1403 [Bryobacterales bacterium]|nr:hypothetical protein [Bryobacterales bacterium]